MIDPLASTVVVADLVNVRFDAAVTVVPALPQLVVEQDAPGVAGLLPPVESTDA